jgi:hypothetical protein
MVSTYIDHITYLKQPTGLTLTTYVGNNARLSANVLADATSLTVPVTTVALSQYDPVYVFDGPNSEQLQVGSGGAILGATSIPLQVATAFAHNAGTPYCTDGTAGSLGEQIFIASRWIEDDICHQALWQTAYTNEILTMPTMRASIDSQRNLHFRPRHFPITTLTSLSIMTVQGNSISYDPTAAIIDSDQQTVDIPMLTAVGGNQANQGNPWLWRTVNRTSNAWLTLAYTAGFAVGALPPPVTRACTLLTSECFSTLVNPTGADQINQGKRSVMFMLRGDTSGESLLIKNAIKYLTPYIAESF